jgi:hypothetical protein
MQFSAFLDKMQKMFNISEEENEQKPISAVEEQMTMMMVQIRKKQVRATKKNMRLQQAMKRLLHHAQRSKGDFTIMMWRMRTATIAQG